MTSPAAASTSTATSRINVRTRGSTQAHPVYGERFTRCLANMGIREVIIAPRAPWQNPFVERVIGSIRRECLDQVLILNHAHLRRLLRAYVAYYNAVRPHQALDNNAPRPREVQPPCRGRVIAIPQVAGLHHRYTRVA